MAKVYRQCQTCRHFATAPLAGKGWCRNPALYDEGYQHVVRAGDLECKRAFGDFWEPAPHVAERIEAEGLATAQPVVDMVPGLRQVRWYWAVLAVVAVVAGFWLAPVAASWWEIIVDPGPPPAPSAAAFAAKLPTAVLPSPSPTPQPTAGPVVAVAATPTTAAVLPSAPAPSESARVTPTTDPGLILGPRTAVSTAPAVAWPTAVLGTATARSLKPGMTVIVATRENGVRLRLRKGPGLTSPIIARIENGQTLRVIDGPEKGSAYTWWQVEFGGQKGWVAGAYLEPMLHGLEPALDPDEGTP